MLDFGVAKQARRPWSQDGTQTVGATVVGTPAYMAPEQLRGHAVDGRADVFSLGVMTFEMLTGALPYGAGSFVDIGVAHAEGRLTGAERVPAALRGVVLSAIARDPRRDHGRQQPWPTRFARARAACPRTKTGCVSIP